MPNRPKTHKPLGQATVRKAYDRQQWRKADQKFYHSARWLAFRRSYLAATPLCQRCEQAGTLRAAVHLHHDRPRSQYPELELDPSNVIGLCHSCHSTVEGQRRGTPQGRLFFTDPPSPRTEPLSSAVSRTIGPPESL